MFRGHQCRPHGLFLVPAKPRSPIKFDSKFTRLYGVLQKRQQQQAIVQDPERHKKQNEMAPHAAQSLSRTTSRRNILYIQRHSPNPNRKKKATMRSSINTSHKRHSGNIDDREGNVGDYWTTWGQNSAAVVRPSHLCPCRPGSRPVPFCCCRNAARPAVHHVRCVEDAGASPSPLDVFAQDDRDRAAT